MTTSTRSDAASPPSPPPGGAGRAIRLDSVTKVYANDVLAVDDVSLDIADGEFMVLVGPSGCGKSKSCSAAGKVARRRFYVGS